MIPWFAVLPWLHYFNFSLKEARYEMRFEKDKRYYVIRLEKDLLDYWAITAINGRVKTKLGQKRILAFLSYSDAFEHLVTLIKIRYQHHYQLKTLYSDYSNFLSTMFFLLENKNYSRNKIQAKKESKSGRGLIQNNYSTSIKKNGIQSTHYQLSFLFNIESIYI